MKPKTQAKKKSVMPSLQVYYKRKSRRNSERLKYPNSSLRCKKKYENVLNANTTQDILKPQVLNYCECLHNCKSLWRTEYYSSLFLQKEVLEWAFGLCKANVKEMYEETVGWDEEGKFNEMTHPTAKYIVITDKDTQKLLAFSHFRFDIDYSEEVLYCYELHVIPERRGRGIGNFLLGLLESIAVDFKMEKVILTVFKSNGSAIRFYEKNGYEEDRTNPDGKSYKILSKYVNNKR